MDAHGLARGAQSRSDCARWNEPSRLDWGVDASDTACWIVARVWPLGILRQRIAAFERPSRPWFLCGPNPWRGDYRHGASRNQFLQTIAEEFLPNSNQIPWWSAPTLWCDARAWICDERCVFFPCGFRFIESHLRCDVPSVLQCVWPFGFGLPSCGGGYRQHRRHRLAWVPSVGRQRWRRDCLQHRLWLRCQHWIGTDFAPTRWTCGSGWGFDQNPHAQYQDYPSFGGLVKHLGWKNREIHRGGRWRRGFIGLVVVARWPWIQRHQSRKIDGREITIGDGHTCCHQRRVWREWWLFGPYRLQRQGVCWLCSGIAVWHRGGRQWGRLPLHRL